MFSSRGPKRSGRRGRAAWLHLKSVLETELRSRARYRDRCSSPVVLLQVKRYTVLIKREKLEVVGSDG